MMIEVIGNCTLYLGDMLDIVPTLKPVKCVCSDVPYLLTSGGNTTAQMSGKFSKENYDNSGEIIDCDIEFNEFMPVIYQALDRGHVYLMVNNRNVEKLLYEARMAGFGFHNLLGWNKISPTPNRWYMKNMEFTGFFYKGKAFYINNCSARALTKCPLPDGKFHNTEKPVMLMRHYIENSTQIGEMVLDPFMGSGSTGIACIESDRKFIGIEINEKCFDVACNRISKAQNNIQGILI